MKRDPDRDEENEFVFEEEDESVWIKIGNIDVYVSRKDEGVSVTLYAESGESLTETWATWQEAEEEQA